MRIRRGEALKSLSGPQVVCQSQKMRRAMEPSSSSCPANMSYTFPIALHTAHSLHTCGLTSFLGSPWPRKTYQAPYMLSYTIWLSLCKFACFTKKQWWNRVSPTTPNVSGELKSLRWRLSQRYPDNRNPLSIVRLRWRARQSAGTEPSNGISVICSILATFT